MRTSANEEAFFVFLHAPQAAGEKLRVTDLCAASRPLIEQEYRPTALEKLVQRLGVLHHALALPERCLRSAGCSSANARARLRSYFRRCRWLRARVDRTVQTSREEASLFHTCLPSKREVKHLSSRPRCDQPIADVDREDLPRLSAGRRN